MLKKVREQHRRGEMAAIESFHVHAARFVWGPSKEHDRSVERCHTIGKISGQNAPVAFLHEVSDPTLEFHAGLACKLLGLAQEE
jgi:hypothetical protein